MLRTLATNFCTAVSSWQFPSSFLLTLAMPVSALLFIVTSLDALLSSLRPVHVEIDNSTSMELELMDGTLFVSASLTFVAAWLVMSFSVTWLLNVVSVAGAP